MTRSGWTRSLLIALSLTILITGAALAAPAGSVVGLSGECFVESGGNRTVLTLGAAVQVGDTVDVPADGRLKLRMADGSIVAVASGTRFKIVVYAVSDGGQRQDAQLSLGQGLLHAIVAPVQQPAKFEIDTAVGAAAARSTDWFIETTLTADEITVLSGSVSVTSAATRHSVVLAPHQTTRLEAGRDPAPPRAYNPAEFGRLMGRTEVRRGRPEEHRDGEVQRGRAEVRRGRPEPPRHAHPPPREFRRRGPERPHPHPYPHPRWRHPPEHRHP